MLMRLLRFAAIPALAVCLQAGPILTNGSLTGPIANASLPSGWDIFIGSPDTMDQNNNVGVTDLLSFIVAPGSPSPDGGTWVGFGRDPGSGFIEQFGQTLSGFTPGVEYSL